MKNLLFSANSEIASRSHDITISLMNMLKQHEQGAFLTAFSKVTGQVIFDENALQLDRLASPQRIMNNLAWSGRYHLIMACVTEALKQARIYGNTPKAEKAIAFINRHLPVCEKFKVA